MDRMFYTIEEYEGRKCFHYEGFACSGYEDEPNEDNTRLIDLTWLFIPVEEMATITCDEIDELEADVQQYIFDGLTDVGIKRMVANYFCDENGNYSPGKYLPFREVNEDTPCGNYWCNGWWMEDVLE